MKSNKDISLRMREMLTRDDVPIRDGFVAAMKSDLEKLLSAYFEPASSVSVAIDRDREGGYAVTVSFSASAIKRFDTTMDIKRG